MTSFHNENYKIVEKGPEMTPEMRESIQAALIHLLNDGIANALNPQKVLGLIDETIGRIEQAYLGIGKTALKDIERAIEENHHV